MKRLMGLAILCMSLAVETHAQANHVTAAASGGSTVTTTSAGAGGGGGGYGGGSAGSRPASLPPAVFHMTSISGSRESYEPSTFVSYDQAVAAGKSLINTPPPTVAGAARQQASTHAGKAKLALVQDDDGRVQLVRR
jgi:hypothetical protein